MDPRGLYKSSDNKNDHAQRVYGASQDVQYLMWLLRNRAKHISRTMSWEYVAMGIAEINEVARCAADIVRELHRDADSEDAGVNVGRTIRYMQTLLRTVAGPYVSMNYEIPQSDVVARISAPALEQVMINLVSNARNAGSEVVTVSMRHERSTQGERFRATISGFICVAVSDDGCGLEEQLGTEPGDLVRFDREAEWFGTGLATVTRIVRAAGGSFGLVNRPEAGLVAEVRLPTLV